jgi:Protein of unknown function (DUF3303)
MLTATRAGRNATGRTGGCATSETETVMLFMTIERFRERDARAVYRNFREHGRMLPDGLTYVGSWVEANFDRCFQLMECDDARLLQQWATRWHGLVDFEFVPVVPGKETAEAIDQFL